MGGDQATSTLLEITVNSLRRQGDDCGADELGQLRDRIRSDYDRQMDVRYGAARGWVDAVIDPAETREIFERRGLWPASTA